MPTRSSVQYTIRGIPPEVDKALRRKAHARKVSLNQLLVDELTNATGEAAPKKYRSLKGLRGMWKKDPEFDRILAEQRKIDWEMWR